MTRPLVLVVEDDTVLSALVASALDEEGFAVERAGDGLEGLLKFRMHTPAAVLLDLVMPDVGGMRVLDQLADEHADVPVIVITGHPRAAAEARDRLDPDDVFEKPFDLPALIVRVHQVARGKAPPRTEGDT